MNILRNILSNPSIKSAHFIDNRTLMQIGLIVLKEAEVQEKRSSKRPGIAAIEYLLNCKYDIIEQYDLNSHAKDQILGTIDKVINQFAKKYGIVKQGKNFYLPEEVAIAIMHPESNIDQRQYLLAQLYAEKQKLHILKTQLSRQSLQGSEILQKAILNQEALIKDLHKQLASTYTFTNESVEDHKKTATQLLAGAAVGHKLGSAASTRKARARWQLDNKENYAKRLKDVTNKSLNHERNIQKQGALATDTYQKAVAKAKSLAARKNVKPETKAAAKADAKAAGENIKKLNKLMGTAQERTNKIAGHAAGYVKNLDKYKKPLQKVAKKGGVRGALVGTGLVGAAKLLSMTKDRKHDKN